MDHNIRHRRLQASLVKTRGRLTRLAAYDAFVIPVALAIAFLILVISGGLALLPAGMRALVSYAIFALFLVSLVRASMRFRKPDQEAVRETLDATDPHRPLSALRDHPASYSQGTKTYWERHRDFLESRAQHLTAPDLAAQWRQRDPLLLRFLAPIALLIIVGVNFKFVPTRLAEAVSPDIGAVFGADQLEVSAWLTPPEHTGEAPVYLTSTTEDVRVPAGSTLTFRVHGAGPPVLKRRATTDQPIDGRRTVRLQKFVDGAYQAELKVGAPQTISLHYWGKRGSWTIETAPDANPDIQFVSDPVLDEQDRLSFRWKATDDYGIAKVFLRLTTIEESGITAGQTDLIPLDLPMAFQKSAEDTARLDLVRHKWAGLTVSMTLEVLDTGGNRTLSADLTYKLPEKLLLEPLAKSSQEIRVTLMRENETYRSLNEPKVKSGVFDGLGDRLSAAPVGVQQAALMIDAVTYKPEIFTRDYAIYLGLKRALETIRGAVSMDDLLPLDNLLWAVTLRAEYGTLADAERRLAAARRALEQALRNGASEEEIRRLMQAFREAVEDFLAARMAEALTNGNPSDPGAGGGNELGGQDLEDMLSALEDLAETGATDAARKLLDDVANLLNNLQFQAGGSGSGGMPGEPGDGEDPDEKASDEEKALQGALDKLSKLLEDQRKLNDDTLQERFGSTEPKDDGSNANPNGQQGNGQIGDGSDELDGQAGPGGQDETSLADRQAQILKDLEAFSEQLGEDTGMGSGMSAEEFERAKRALERAENALKRGDLDAAQWNQDRAIQDLRDAAGDLAGKLDAEKAARLGQNGKDTINNTDPLGRPNGGVQPNDGENVAIPDKLDRQRARDILDDLRKRLDQSTDEEEREYLKRLLDRFGS